MDDKQVYTTAKSEEIKRQLVKYKKDFETWIAERRKKKKAKIKIKPTPTPPPLPPVPQVVNKLQETVPGAIDNLYKESADKPKKESKDNEVKGKHTESNYLNDKLKGTITYLLFGAIILFVLLGIFLTYKTR